MATGLENVFAYAVSPSNTLDQPGLVPGTLPWLESNPQLSFATRMEDWTSLGQHKRHPECPVVTRESRRNSRKTTWLPRHRKMKPFPSTASQEKSHVHASGEGERVIAPEPW